MTTLFFTTNDAGVVRLVQDLATAEILQRDLRHHRVTEWPSDVGALLDLPGEVLAHLRYERAEEAALDMEGAVLVLALRHGTLRVEVSAASDQQIAAVLEELGRRYPVARVTEEQRIAVNFWALGPRGPECFRRKIDVPTWEEIQGNYSEAHHVHSALDHLMGSFQPGRGGQLILWLGPAGTGKTFALRALGWEWRSWARIEYITDPEVMFGREPAYLLQVLLNSAGDQPDHADGTSPKWMLLVLEDTGELLSPDAKTQHGQSLSRLLNVVDGLIGQGLRVLVLITTNDPLTRLHDAVIRPGRCASKIQFEALTYEETARWLADHNVEGSKPGEVTLAELYGELDGRPAQQRVSVGFSGEG